MTSLQKTASQNLRRTVDRVRRFLFGPSQVPPEIIVNGVHISVDVEATEHFFDFNATGARVWPSAPVLIRHLEKSPSLRRRLRGARVLELGSGLGLVGLSIAALEAKKVCLTDRLVPRFANPRGTSGPILHSDFQLKALDSNVEANTPALRHTGCELIVKELAFGDLAAATHIVDEHGPFDVVVGSDVTFFEPAIPALVETLRCVSRCESAETGDSPPAVVLAHARRRKGLETSVLTALKEAGFSVDIVEAETEEGAVALLECHLSSC